VAAGSLTDVSRVLVVLSQLGEPIPAELEGVSLA
jgi:hypothetical protein